MSKYEYVDRRPTGGWILEVRRGAAHLGNIRKNRTTGRFQFFRGSKNAIRPILEEPTLAELIQDIEGIDL